MKNIFPKEFLDYSIEVHRFKNLKKSQTIYWVLLALIFILCLSLPFIKIDLFQNSRGLITSGKEFIPQQSLVALSIDTSNSFVKEFDNLKKVPYPYRDHSLSPQTDLMVQCYVSPVGMTFLEKGDQVKFQLDDFPHKTWGMASGNITHLNQNLIDLKGLQMYKVTCSIREAQLILNNQTKANLRTGMKLTAKFFLEKKSLFQLFFDHPKTNNNRS